MKTFRFNFEFSIYFGLGYLCEKVSPTISSSRLRGHTLKPFRVGCDVRKESRVSWLPIYDR